MTINFAFNSTDTQLRQIIQFKNIKWYFFFILFNWHNTIEWKETNGSKMTTAVAASTAIKNQHQIICPDAVEYFTKFRGNIRIREFAWVSFYLNFFFLDFMDMFFSLFVCIKRYLISMAVIARNMRINAPLDAVQLLFALDAAPLLRRKKSFMFFFSVVCYNFYQLFVCPSEVASNEEKKY